jgi:hypothetical protein
LLPGFVPRPRQVQAQAVAERIAGFLEKVSEAR